MKQPKWPFAEIAVLLLFFGVRVHEIARMAFFADESVFVGWGQDFSSSISHLPVLVSQGMLLLPALLSTVQPFNEIIWITRVTVVLISLLAAASVYGIGRLLFNRHIGLLAIFLYSLLRYTFFHERQVLSDPLANALGLFSLFLLIVCFKIKPTRLIAVLAGVMLGLMLYAKIITLVFLAVPVLAWLALSRKKHTLPLLIWIYVPALVMLALPMLPTLYLSDYETQGFYGSEYRGIRFSGSRMIKQTYQNSITYFSFMMNYFGVVASALAVIGIIMALFRRNWQALLLLAYIALNVGSVVPLGNWIVPRWMLISIGAYILFTAWALWEILALIRRKSDRALYPAAVFSVIMAVMLIPQVQFIHLAYTEPQKMPLVPLDNWQYVNGDMAGVRMQDTAAFLLETSETSPVTWVVARPGVLLHLSMYLSGNPQFRLIPISDVTPAWLSEKIAADEQVLLVSDGQEEWKDETIVADFMADRRYTIQQMREFGTPDGYYEGKLTVYALGVGE